MNIKELIADIGAKAVQASHELSMLSGEKRAAILNSMPAFLDEARDELFAANKRDLEKAVKNGIAGPLLKRLEVTEKVYRYIHQRLTEAAALPDPLNKTIEGFVRPNGLEVKRISVPIGVIGIIYESRPNVTTDAAAVCLKSGNAVILRGGSESFETNMVLAKAMRKAIAAQGVSPDAVQLIETTDREAVGEMLKLEDSIDLLIPRGGKSLIKRISAESKIPVLKHYDGICHQYISASADLEKAVAVVVNSKCQRVEVCNALETLLVDKKIADKALPLMAAAFGKQGVVIKGCENVCRILTDAEPATEEDWSTEYLDAIISVKVVNGVKEAIDHINKYSSGHTDGIITESMQQANLFVKGVDSASVLVNASTRLSGGGDYGMGAVVGISTDKLHARGPVGPAELTSYKWVAIGDGHIR